MTKEERKKQNMQLLQRIREGDKSAYNDIIKLNEPLIVKIINRYFSVNHNVDRDELLQEGRISVIEAVDYYIKDPNPQHEFSTFIGNSIIYHILKHIKRELKSNNKNSSFNKNFSLDEQVSNEQYSYDMLYYLADEKAMVEDKALENYDNEKTLDLVWKSLKKKFSPFQIDIFKTIKISQDGATIEDIAKQFGVSKQYVSYIVNKMLSYLKKELNQQSELEKDNELIRSKGFKSKNIISSSLGNPELMAKIKTIVKTRLSKNQRKVVDMLYFNDKAPNLPYYKVAQKMDCNISDVYSYEHLALKKIEEELLYNKSGNIILDNIDNPEMLEKIKLIIDTRLSPSQKDVINLKYFSEENPEFIKIDEIFGCKKGKSARTHSLALIKIEKELKRLYESEDFIKTNMNNPEMFARIKNIIRFQCSELQQRVFYEIYLNEENKNLNLSEIEEKIEDLDSSLSANQLAIMNKIKNTFASTSAYDLTQIPQRLKDVLGVEEVDSEVFYNAFYCLHDSARAAIYEQYFTQTATNKYDPKRVQKFKEIYHTLLKEKQQEEEAG